MGGGLSVLFRIQLGYPDADLSWMKPLLESGSLRKDILLLNSIMLITMHGTILVFFLTQGLSGTFSNISFLLMIVARGHGIRVYQYVVLLVLLPVQCGHGRCSSGQDLLRRMDRPILPLNALPAAASGSVAGVDYWLVSIVLFIVSVLLGGLNYITTVINLRTRGMKMFRLPLPIGPFS